MSRLNGRLQQAEKQAAALPWYHGLEGEELAAAMRQYERDVETAKGLIQSGRYSLGELAAMSERGFFNVLDQATGAGHVSRPGLP